ncbi:hypothetical protein DPMN_058192 [Dreissena polymorpha]|uniref:DDB1- and CUL4-associated factor 8 n=2 Tax=Dreissena polymorpha TaxID=45954 RepID=A0A9D4C1A2_DREPO|nr:hypothetical protein DPMN_058192 [Dreissena polymorpha]
MSTSVIATSDNSQVTETGLKKDDSGIFSEKSPNVNNSDCDISENMSEFGDENGSESFKKIGPTVSENVFNSVEKSSNKTRRQIIDVAEIDNETDNVDSLDGNSNVISECNSSKDQPLQSNDDHDSDSDFAEFVKAVRKKSSNNETDVNEELDADDFENKTSNVKQDSKRLRNYRKRKQASDSEDTHEETNDGEPVLLRHSELTESAGNQVVTLSDLGSDTDSTDEDEDRFKTKSESSESEPEESPLEVSKFGPPRHKWKALFDIRKRELGCSPLIDTGCFARKVQGSLQMVQRFELQYKMELHEGCVNALSFNKSGTLLSSGSDDLKVVVWNWIQNRPALAYNSGHHSNVFQTKFMPFSGDCHVVSCARDGQVRLADLSATGVCKATKKLAQHKGAAHKLSLEHDSAHTVLSAGEDAVTFEIDLRQDKPNKLVTTKENEKKVSIYSIHSNPVNSNEFCLGGRDNFVRVYDKRKINEAVNDGLLKRFSPHHISAIENSHMKANVTCACYNYNGTELIGTYNDEDIYLFSNEHSGDSDFVHRYRGHRNNQTVKGVNFYGSKSEFIVSGSDCGHIFLWDKETENIVQHMHGDDGGVINVLEPHPHFPVLATSGLDHDVKIWAPTSREPTQLKGIRKAIKRNHREREEERSSEGTMIDSSMLWFIMRHLRQGRQRRARAARREQDNADTDSSEDDDSDEDEEENSMDGDSDSDDGDPRNPMTCSPS